MEGLMFDSGETVLYLTEKQRLPDQDELRERCLAPAEVWVLKRRANLPYLGPQRLPAVARAG